MIGLFDVVALMQDIPQANLKAGARGTVVEKFSHTAFEVEFSDAAGRMVHLGAFHIEQIRHVQTYAGPRVAPNARLGRIKSLRPQAQ